MRWSEVVLHELAEGIHSRVGKKVDGVTLLLNRSLEKQLRVAAM